MAVNRSNTIQPRNLTEALQAAHNQHLEPWTSDNGRWIGLQCPICKQLGREANATIEAEPNGTLKASCAICHDDVEPGILNTLGAITSNVIPLHNPNGNGTHPSTITHTLGAQTWRNFESTAGKDVACIIQGLWPEAALGFIGAAPKAGKTWLGLDIAISVATGTPVFGTFTVPTAHPVLYVALEGHRSAIRSRIGCLSRGHGIAPEGDGLNNLHLAYKPKGINLAQPDWARALCDNAQTIGARFVIVDVLRRAAQIKENEASSFMELVDLLQPLNDAGIALGMLHHFNKVNETTSQRSPAERMAGSGAMFGAFDVGIFITKSEQGARKLTIHTDVRDLAAPPKFLINLTGTGSGQYGGFTYLDTLQLTLEDAPHDGPAKKAPAHEIKAFIIDNGGAAAPGEIQLHFNISETTLKKRREELAVLGVQYLGEGRTSRYEAPETRTPNHPNFGASLGSPEAPQTRPLLRKGIGGLGSEPLPTQDRAEPEFGVNLDDDGDDAGYWAMLNAINDPEAKEHE